MSQTGLSLAGIFQEVEKSLVQNQQSLNQADGLNGDHGDNMVKTFQTIANSLEKKKGSSDSAALAYAAKQLSKSSTSGSAQLYAKGLAQAAEQFQGQQLDSRSAMGLLQTLIGGGQAAQTGGGDVLSSLLGSMASSGQGQSPQAPQGGDDLLGALLGGLGGQGSQAPQTGGGDLLGALLGGMAGGSQPAPQAQPQGGGDLLGSLLGGMTGGSTASGAAANNGLDMGDLLTAGMAFLQAKQSGQDTMQALVQAFMAASGMGGSAHRSQSTQLVVSSFLQALGAGR